MQEKYLLLVISITTASILKSSSIILAGLSMTVLLQYVGISQRELYIIHWKLLPHDIKVMVLRFNMTP